MKTLSIYTDLFNIKRIDFKHKPKDLSSVCIGICNINDEAELLGIEDRYFIPCHCQSLSKEAGHVNIRDLLINDMAIEDFEFTKVDSSISSLKKPIPNSVSVYMSGYERRCLIDFEVPNDVDPYSIELIRDQYYVDAYSPFDVFCINPFKIRYKGKEYNGKLRDIGEYSYMNDIYVDEYNENAYLSKREIYNYNELQEEH